MRLRILFLTISVVFTRSYCDAQVPYYTVLDTVKMREMREKSVHFDYRIDQPYDSLEGKPDKNAKPDTLIHEYDRMGREICFSYINADDRTRAFVRLNINEQGQVTRRFGYDVDSTNGFVDYWTYNQRGQVIYELSKTRHGADENAFRAADFTYDDTGALLLTRYYSVSGAAEKELREYEQFYYQNGLQVAISFNAKGDTTYIDSVGNLHNDLPYWSRRYRYMEEAENGVPRKMLVSETISQYDTIHGLQQQVYHYQRYNYTTGAPEETEIDTGYYDLDGNVIEYRDERFIEKYIYSTKGELEYMMCYNRQMQPLFRRTRVFQYYK